MAFTRDTQDYDIIQALPDIVEDQATSVKQKFDQGGNQGKTYNNDTLLAELESTTLGSSGSDNIGYNGDVPDSTTIKEAVDKVYSGGSGSIPPDGTITNAKLATDVKVGSLAALTTTEKSSVTGSINEVDADVGTNTVNLDIARIAKTDTGAANAYVVDTAGTFDRTIDGNTLPFIPSNANTGASTMAEDSQVAKAIKKWNPDAGPAAFVDVEEGDLLVNVRVDLTWSVSNDFFIYSPKGVGLEFAENGVLVGYDNGAPTTLRTSVVGEGWIISVVSGTSSTFSFNFDVDGSPLFGASEVNDGIGVKPYSSMLIMKKFDTSFDFYCTSGSVGVVYVLGKTIEKGIPKFFGPTNTTSVSLQQSVSGSGWIYGKNSLAETSSYYFRLDIDGSTIIPTSSNSCPVLSEIPFMYRFETGFDFYAPIANAVGISYSLD